MKREVLRKFNIGYFVLILIVLSCLSYGCGGGARDLIILESQKKYVSAVVNTDGTLQYHNTETQIIIEAKEKDTFSLGEQFFIKLASASEVEIGDKFDIDSAVTVVTSDAKIYIPMNELVNKEEELARLNKELKTTEKMLAQDESKLNNEGFMNKAPAAVIEKIKMQAQREKEKIALIKAAIEELQ